jgi:hypothetical protein
MFVAATLGAIFCVSATSAGGLAGCAAAEWPEAAAEPEEIAVLAAAPASVLASGTAGILINTTPAPDLSFDLWGSLAVSVALRDAALGATQSYLQRCAAGMSGTDDMEELR